MGLSEIQDRSPESIDPTGLWRLVFWLAFVIGSLGLLFSWLLAQVPRLPHGADYGLDYLVRSCAAALMLVSIGMARWLWKINHGSPGRGAMQIVQLIAWVELIIAICGIVGLAVSRH